MNSNQPDPVIGVVNPSMSFFQKHTRFQSLAGNRAPLNSIAITPFLQTLFTIPTVVSPSPQTAGLVLDGDDKTDTSSPAESSPESPSSSTPSDTADAADHKSKITDTDATKSNGPPVQGHATDQASAAAPECTPSPALVPDSVWIDETLNAPVSPESILALPNGLTGPSPAVAEGPVPAPTYGIAPVTCVISDTPASPTLEQLSVDPAWTDVALFAPVTPAGILALPEKVLTTEVAVFEDTSVTTAVSAPAEEQDTETPLVPVPTVLIPNHAWMDESLNAPVTPYALLALPEKNIATATSSAPTGEARIPPPSAEAMPIDTTRVNASFDAPVTPYALLALPEKNCTSTASLLFELPLIASKLVEELQTSSSLTQATQVDDQDSGVELVTESVSAFRIVTESSLLTNAPISELGDFEDKAWEDDFVASCTPLDSAYDKMLHDVTFLVPRDRKSEQEELRALTAKTSWKARRLVYAAKGLVLKRSSA